MRKPLLLIGLLIILVYACNQKSSTNALLKPSALASSFFTIDLTKDTILKTEKGAIIKIPKGALVAEGPSTIQLEVKEAYTIREMIVAGLTTQSNGQPLSSGGMIYINAAGENTVRVEKPISVSIPTPWVNKDMQLWQGEPGPDGSIDWTKPDTIPTSNSEKYLATGKGIFEDNCARCHAIGKELTGPDLAFVDRRRGEEGYDGAFSFTWNSTKVLAEGHPYYNCLYEKYNKSPMPPFPSLTVEEMTALYDYIENESYARGLPYPKDRDACYDSCKNYYNELHKLEQGTDSVYTGDLEPDTTPAVRPDAVYPTVAPPVQDTSAFADNVESTLYEPPYYLFNIERLGWFNVDILLKDNPAFVESELTVKITGDYKKHIEVYLVIPSIRVFLNGTLASGADDEYVFFLGKKQIPLPQNAEAYILALGEADKKIVYNHKGFITSLSQHLELSLKAVTKEEFDKATRSLDLKNVSFNIVDYAEQQRVTDSLMAEQMRIGDSLVQVEVQKRVLAISERANRIQQRLDSLKPKTKICDCICAEMEARYRPANDAYIMQEAKPAN